MVNAKFEIADFTGKWLASIGKPELRAHGSSTGRVAVVKRTSLWSCSNTCVGSWGGRLMTQ